MPLRLLNVFASGPEASGIALSHDGTKLYRALSEPCVDIVELATGGVIGKIDLPGRPSRVTVSPDGRIALVPATRREPEGDRGKTYVIDLRTNRLTATLPVGLTPLSAAFSPDGTRAYIPAFGSERVGRWQRIRLPDRRLAAACDDLRRRVGTGGCRQPGRQSCL